MEISGTIVFVDLEGGFFGLLTPTGEQYYPVDQEPWAELVGNPFTANVEPVEAVTSVMWGEPVVVTDLVVETPEGEVVLEEKPLTGQEYNELALDAFEGDRVAAEQVIVEAEARGNAYDPDAVIAWVSARGPFDMSEEAEGEGSFAYEAGVFLQESTVFSTAEALQTAIAAAKTQTDLVEYDGLLDIPARAPQEVLDALGIKLEYDKTSGKSLSEQIKDYETPGGLIPALLIAGGVGLIGYGIKKLVWG